MLIYQRVFGGAELPEPLYQSVGRTTEKSPATRWEQFFTGTDGTGHHLPEKLFFSFVVPSSKSPSPIVPGQWGFYFLISWRNSWDTADTSFFKGVFTIWRLYALLLLVNILINFWPESSLFPGACEKSAKWQEAIHLLGEVELQRLEGDPARASQIVLIKRWNIWLWATRICGQVQSAD
jgi:hypothetical protein